MKSDPDRNFEDVLDECLARLNGGETLDAVLDEHAELAVELRPLLGMAAALRAAPVPRPRAAAVAAGKQKVLAAFAAQVTPVDARNRRQRLRARLAPASVGNAPRWRYAFGTVLALILATSGAVAASSSSLPGDALYPVKQSVENLRLALAAGAESREALEQHFDEQRLLEVQSLVQMRRQTTATFTDALQARGANGWWTIGPFAVRVTTDTAITGQPAVGSRVRALVRVEDDGTLTALQISEAPTHLREPEHDAEELEFVSPLPAVSDDHEQGRDAEAHTPTPVTHDGEAGEDAGSAHDAAPSTSAPFAPTPARNPEPTDTGAREHTVPRATSRSIPHQPEATEPPRHAEPTGPAQLPAATESPAHDAAQPATTEPPHDAGGGGGHEGNGGD
jgi:hypothetical protein